jgi:hypothetical protein
MRCATGFSDSHDLHMTSTTVLQLSWCSLLNSAYDYGGLYLNLFRRRSLITGARWREAPAPSNWEARVREDFPFRMVGGKTLLIGFRHEHSLRRNFSPSLEKADRNTIAVYP